MSRKIKKVEAEYKFIKKFVTQNKTYLPNEDCFETNEDVLKFLKKENLIIKK